MKKKPRIPKQMTEAKKALKSIMQDNLTSISKAMLKQIMSRVRKSTPSSMLDAIKKVDKPGIQSYKSLLKTALGVIAYDALIQVRKEIPKASHVKLSDPVVDLNHPLGHLASGEMVYQLDEFDSLPPSIQDKITDEANLVVESQLSDIEKEVYFQFLSSYDSTDSADLIEGDLQDAMMEYIEGSAIDSGAGIIAAEIINEARDAFFSNDEVKDQIDALQFVNGDPVTTICTKLDGVIFDQDDPLSGRFQPPFHWNCKTYVIAILAGNLEDGEVESLTDYAGLEGEMQFSESKSKAVRLLKEMRHSFNCTKDH